jgi:hypothetical protein
MIKNSIMITFNFVKLNYLKLKREEEKFTYKEISGFLMLSFKTKLQYFRSIFKAYI